MNGDKGYRIGKQPYRYGCHEYSLEMQLLQLKKKELQETDFELRQQLAARIEEIEDLLGM